MYKANNRKTPKVGDEFVTKPLKLKVIELLDDLDGVCHVSVVDENIGVNWILPLAYFYKIVK